MIYHLPSVFSLSLSAASSLSFSTRYYASSQQKENNSGHLGALFKTIRAYAYLLKVLTSSLFYF
jgi:hypothetical protein